MLQFLFRPREHRLKLCQDVEVRVAGSSVTTRGQVIDVSSNGIGLWIPTPLANGTTLLLDAGETELVTEVCYCQPHPGGFRVGLLVTERRSRELVCAHDSGDSRRATSVPEEARLGGRNPR